jgi:hypothetical protein
VHRLSTGSFETNSACGFVLLRTNGDSTKKPFVLRSEDDPELVEGPSVSKDR